MTPVMLGQWPINGVMLIIVGLIGLSIGSFLNVVIYRLSTVFFAKAKLEAYSILEQTAPCELQQELIHNDLLRRSACPQCHRPLKIWHNIPILSYLLLKGRCGFCQARIHWQYPVVEGVTAFVFLLTFALYGLSITSVAYSVVWCFLIVGSAIDLRYYILPDEITLIVMWGGLLFNLFTNHLPIDQAVLGAVIGYMLLWGSYWLFKLFTGKEGMGYGDFKLLAALGAWFGVSAVIFIVFVSAFVGIFLAAMASVVLRRGVGMIPYGPAIAVSGLLYTVIGEPLIQWYVSLLVFQY